VDNHVVITTFFEQIGNMDRVPSISKKKPESGSLYWLQSTQKARVKTNHTCNHSVDGSKKHGLFHRTAREDTINSCVKRQHSRVRTHHPRAKDHGYTDPHLHPYPDCGYTSVTTQHTVTETEEQAFYGRQP